MRQIEISEETLLAIRKDLILTSDTKFVAEKYGKTRMAIYSLIRNKQVLQDWKAVRNYNIAYEYEHGADVEAIANKYHIQRRAVYIVVKNTSLEDKYELI